MFANHPVITRKILLKIWIYLIILGHIIALIPSSRPQGPNLIKKPAAVVVDHPIIK